MSSTIEPTREAAGGLANVLFSGWASVLGLVLLLGPLLALVMTPSVQLPWWESDPLMGEVLLVGVTPAWQAWLLACSAIGAGVLMVAGGAPNRAWWVMAALGTIGAAAVAWHAWLGPDRSIDDARVGGAWLAGIAAGLALSHAGGSSLVRRVAGGALLGAVIVLALKGVAQVVFEHPALVEGYRATREQVLASNGWTPESPMARAYERRLMQNEATGWLGFSNIYASLCAAGAAAALGVVLTRLRDGRAARAARLGASAASQREDEAPRRDWALLAGATVVVAGVAGVAMAGGKGGWGVLVVGCVLVVALTLGKGWLGRRVGVPGSPRAQWTRRGVTWLGLALCAVMLALVGLRGIVGDRVGELSILYRAMYIEASVRMTIDGALARPNPAGPDLVGVTGPMGTGPVGFKNAYVVYKNPRQPEDVASPHSVLFDWTACLGPLGLAWCALGAWWLLRAGRAGADEVLGARVKSEARHANDGLLTAFPNEVADTHMARLAARGVCLVACAATIICIPHVGPALTGEELLVRLGGLVLWCAIGGAVATIGTRGPNHDGAGGGLASGDGVRVALLAAASVLAMHAQIEQSAHWPASAPILLAVLGLAAAGQRGGPVTTATRADAAASGSPSGGARSAASGSMLLALLGAVPALAAAALLGLGAVRADAWERGLWAGVLAVEADKPIKERARVRTEALEAAAEALLRGVRDGAEQFQTRREASRLLVLASQIDALRAGAKSARASELFSRALWAAVPASRVASATAGAKQDARDFSPWPRPAALDVGVNAHLGLMATVAAGWLGESDLLPRAEDHLAMAARQDPSAPMHTQRLMDVRRRLGDVRGAAEAARATLVRDALQAFDPASRGLSDRERAAVQRAIDAEASQPSPASVPGPTGEGAR